MLTTPRSCAKTVLSQIVSLLLHNGKIYLWTYFGPVSGYSDAVCDADGRFDLAAQAPPATYSSTRVVFGGQGFWGAGWLPMLGVTLAWIAIVALKHHQRPRGARGELSGS